MCRGFSQLHAEQALPSIRSGRRELALSKEIKNVWVQILSTTGLTYGLLEAGAYEEALVLTKHTVALARTFPLMEPGFLIALGSTYHALQQWEEARSTLEDAEAGAETLHLGLLR